MRQSRDGAWRSNTYGAFRNGDALTPLVLWALQNMADCDAATRSAFQRGVMWLRGLSTTHERSGVRSLAYPLFTASYATQIFARAHNPAATQLWLKIVQALEIRGNLGGPAGSAASGAWGDAIEPPQPAVDDATQTPDMIAPNLSATLLGLDALTAADQRKSAHAATPFILRCQNFAEEKGSDYDDGGFFYAVDDAVRNKAGVAGIDEQRRERYRSYGSATCDGILALRAAGMEWNEPRCIAALGWLSRKTQNAENAGAWPVERQDARDALFFYHAQAFARVLAVVDEAKNIDSAWTTAQRGALAAGLCERQCSDGAWAGVQPDSCEDDPLVATSFALRALTTIRSATA